MSTIPDNPVNATKPETHPAVPTTADQRLAHTNINSAFAAAKTDVEALETGKEDAGTAAAEVATHDGNAAAHGGVEASSAAHIADLANPHSVTAAQAGAEPAGSVAVHDGSGAAHGGVEAAFATHTSGQVNAHTAIDTHIASIANPHGVTAAQVGAITAVVDDTSPALGGELLTEGNHVVVRRAIGTEVGRLVDMDTVEGVALAHTTIGDFDPEDGAVAVLSGATEVYGAAARVVSLKHTDARGKAVFVGIDGGLYPVPPPEPGWSVTDSSTGDYDLGTGTGAGAWVATGLVMTIPQDVNSGDRLNIQASLYAANKTTNRSGQVEVGFGVDAAQPAGVGGSAPVGPGYEGYIHVAFITTTVTLTASQTITIYARINNGSNAQYGVDLVGSSFPHSSEVSTPGEGGGGSSTFIGLIDTPGSYAGESGKLAAVNGTSDGIEFIDPPTGSGDVTSPGTTDQVVQIGSGAAKGIQDSGVDIADVARRSVANTFLAQINIEPPTGEAAFRLKSADEETEIYLDPGTGPADGQIFSITAVAGQWQLRTRLDNYSFIRNVCAIGHDGGMQFGAPTGGVPSIGAINAESLQVDGVEVYHVGNPPPGSGGDMVAPGGMVVGELYAAANVSGTLTAGTSIQATNVALLDTSNTFTADQILQSATPISLDLFQTGQTGQSGRFSMQSSTGFLFVYGLNDAGTPVGSPVVQVAHPNAASQGVVIGNTAFAGAGTLAAENGLFDGAARVYSDTAPGTVIRSDNPSEVDADNGFSTATTIQASGGTFNPDPQAGQMVQLTGSTDTTIGLLVNPGDVSIAVPNAIATITLDGGYTSTNTRPSGRASILELRDLGAGFRFASWV